MSSHAAGSLGGGRTKNTKVPRTGSTSRSSQLMRSVSKNRILRRYCKGLCVDAIKRQRKLDQVRADSPDIQHSRTMCRRTTCSTCNKPTWAGCGMHVEAVSNPQHNLSRACPVEQQSLLPALRACSCVTCCNTQLLLVGPCWSSGR